MYSIVVAMVVFAVGLLGRAAGDEVKIPEVGVHHPILVVQKNVNPQNLMVVYTKLDAEGRFAVDPLDRGRPVFDFYWLMDGKNYKPVHPLIKNEIGKRLECQVSEGDRATRFVIHINDLKEVKSDIKEPKVDVRVRETAGARVVEAQMNLGPSDGSVRIKLSSIYTEGRAFPPAVYAVTLKGEEIVDGKLTGKKVERRYAAKE